MSDSNQTNYAGGFSFGGQGTPQSSQPIGQSITPNTQVTPPQPAPVTQDPYSAAMPPADPGAQDDKGSGPPADEPDYVFGKRMQSFTTTVTLLPHQLRFDEAHFINLLAGSISLSREEKKRILDSIPKLRQEQVDELIRIFEEERAKFIELSPKHGAQLKKLEIEHAADWKDIELSYKAENKSQEDAAAAEALKKQLGL